jgi:hypothetical protein
MKQEASLLAYGLVIRHGTMLGSPAGVVKLASKGGGVADSQYTSMDYGLLCAKSFFPKIY